MNITVAVVLALASVAAYAAAAATQHRVASTGGHGLRRLSADPAWWASNSANATGATLHVAALTYGPLTLGQCLGALTVTAAVPLAARGAGRRVSRGEWHGMALTLAGFAALPAHRDRRGRHGRPHHAGRPGHRRHRLPRHPARFLGPHNDIGFGSMIKRCVTVALAYQALGGGTYIPEDAPCRGH
ncbi:hypothetical protein [Streptomyces sp. NPDC002491]